MSSIAVSVVLPFWAAALKGDEVLWNGEIFRSFVRPSVRPSPPLGLAGWASGLAGWASGLAGWSSGLAGWSSGLAGWASDLAGWASVRAGWPNCPMVRKYLALPKRLFL